MGYASAGAGSILEAEQADTDRLSLQPAISVAERLIEKYKVSKSLLGYDYGMPPSNVLGQIPNWENGGTCQIICHWIDIHGLVVPNPSVVFATGGVFFGSVNNGSKQFIAHMSVPWQYLWVEKVWEKPGMMKFSTPMGTLTAQVLFGIKDSRYENWAKLVQWYSRWSGKRLDPVTSLEWGIKSLIMNFR